MRDIAVVILNYVQYTNIIAGIERLIELGYTVDIYCDSYAEGDTTGFNDMFNDISEICKKKNLNVYRKADPELHYKVSLEPYPQLDINADYKIKYRYSELYTKPGAVYVPENFIMYDAVLSSGSYDSNIISAYTKPLETAAMKFCGFEKTKERKSDKKQLLYLPTYGDECTIEQILPVLDEIKKDYYVVAKVHHGTNFLSEEKDRISLLKEKVDELYDSHKELSELLSSTDVILTDNSGAIFDGIYTEIPVAVFCDDINRNRLGEFDTIQYELYREGILPYTSKPEEIGSILKKALSDETVKKQTEWNRLNFCHSENCVDDFVRLIKDCMEGRYNKKNYQLHHVLRDEYYGTRKALKQSREDFLALQGEAALTEAKLDNEYKVSAMYKGRISDLEREMVEVRNELTDKLKNEEAKVAALTAEKAKLEETIAFLKKQLEYYETGALYKLASKIYKCKNGK